MFSNNCRIQLGLYPTLEPDSMDVLVLSLGPITLTGTRLFLSWDERTSTAMKNTASYLLLEWLR